jgi:hypothetical protein
MGKVVYHAETAVDEDEECEYSPIADKEEKWLVWHVSTASSDLLTVVIANT